MMMIIINDSDINNNIPLLAHWVEHRRLQCHVASAVRPEGKERKEKEYLYSAILANTVKALRHGSHSFTCKLHHVCLSLVSVHQMAPPRLR